MASKQVVDIEALLAPIAGDNPAGKDISVTGVIAELTELRRTEEAENLGEWAPKELKTANWTKVIKLGVEVFTNQSKDVRIAGFLVEAYINQGGVAGLRDGLQLIRELQERYWDTMYPSIQPPPVEEGEEAYEEDNPINVRAAALGRLDLVLSIPVPFAKVTKPALDRPPLTHADWKMANYYDNLQKGGEKEKKAFDEAMAEGKASGEIFRKAVSQTSKEFYQNFVEDVDAAMAELEKLNAMIEDKYREAEELPVFSQMRKTLEEVNHMVSDIEKITGPLRATDEVPTEEGATGAGEEGGPKRAKFTGDGVPLEPMDRSDAIRRLQAVATYFRSTEPHSPVTYLVERAIYWSGISLEQWLEEVVKDSSTLSMIRETLGVKPPEGSSGY